MVGLVVKIERERESPRKAGSEIGTQDEGRTTAGKVKEVER
jgi:hypothetical protein